MILIFYIFFYIFFLFNINILIASKMHVDRVPHLEYQQRSRNKINESNNISSAKKASNNKDLSDSSKSRKIIDTTKNKPFSISQFIFNNSGEKSFKSSFGQVKEPQDQGIHLDQTKIVTSHKEQGQVGQITVKYNQKMTGPLPNYIDQLANNYKNVAAIVPEIFTTYAVRFLDPTKTFIPGVYSPDQLVIYGKGEKWFDTYRWSNLKNIDSQLPNLYKGLNFLNSLYGRPDFIFNEQATQRYLPILQAKFPHVPNKLLATYISIAKPSGSLKNFEQKIEQQIKTCNADNFDYNLLSDLNNEKFDLDRLYLTMQAVESIHSSQDYVPFLKRPTQTMTIEKAITTPGISDLLLNTQQNKVTIDHQEEIAKTYSFTQDTNPEQLQIDWIMLNQDILALDKTIANLPQNQLTKRNQLILLQNDALAVSNKINETIIEQKYQETLSPLLPSAGVNIFKTIDTVTELKEHLKKEQTQPPSQIIIKYNEQIDEIYRKVGSTLHAIHDQLDLLPKVDKNGNPTTGLLMESFISSDFEEALLEKSFIQKNIKSAENAVKNSSPDQRLRYEKILLEKKEVVAQLNLMLKRLQNIEDHAEQQAAIIKNNLLTNLETNNRNLQTHKAAVIIIFEQLKQNIKIPTNRLKNLDDILSKYEKESNQDLIVSEDNDLSAQLAELNSLFRWDTLDDLSLIKYKTSVKAFNDIILDYETTIKATKKEEFLDEKIKTYSDKLVQHTIAQNRTIDSRISMIEKKIIALNQKNEKNSIFDNKTKEIEELNKLLVIDNTTYRKKIIDYEEKNLIIFEDKDIQSRSDLITIYQKLLEKLKAESALYKAQEQMKSVQENFYQGNYSKAIRDLAYAGTNQTVAAKDIARSIFGPIWDILPWQIQYSIIIGLVSLSTELVAIEANPYLTDEQKKELRDKAIKAIFTDFYTIILGYTTGASTNTVATGNTQAIATEAGLHTIIKLLTPHDPNLSNDDSLIHNPAYLSNFDKFKAQYAAELSQSQLQKT